MAGMSLMIVEGRDGPPSLAAAAAQLGVADADMDTAFGVIPIDPAKGLYCVQVRADSLPPGTASAKPFRGPFSNPRIASLGSTAPSSDSSEGASDVRDPNKR